MQISKISLLICGIALCSTLVGYAEDNPAQAAARKALEQKMSEMEKSACCPATNASACCLANPSGDNEAQAKARIALKEKMAEIGTAAAPACCMASQSGDNEAQVKARAALKEKMVELGAPVAPASAPVVQAKSESGVVLPTPPPLPIKASKEARLQELLAQYKADQITPQAYHEQRAAILAEP